MRRIGDCVTADGDGRRPASPLARTLRFERLAGDLAILRDGLLKIICFGISENSEYVSQVARGTGG